jgi:hypothetical protein
MKFIEKRGSIPSENTTTKYTKALILFLMVICFLPLGGGSHGNLRVSEIKKLDQKVHSSNNI